jgi:hypothetical protein
MTRVQTWPASLIILLLLSCMAWYFIIKFKRRHV